jgi:AcrR family transcriptional regulator
MENLSKRNVKRKCIAKSCCALFTKNGFTDISISILAKTAGIGKGTIYEYFENKEDIVFELMTCLQEDYDEKFNLGLEIATTKEEKILKLFDLFISKDENILIQKEIYNQFLIICISKPNDKIIYYNMKLRKKYISLLKKILSNNTQSARIYDTIVGFFIASNSLYNYDLEFTIKNFIKNELKLNKEEKWIKK